MKGLRQGTVEPVFGSLTQYYGLNKIAVLGIDGAHKTMLMAAIAFNIKKYMTCHPKKVAENALQKAKRLPLRAIGQFHLSFGCRTCFFIQLKRAGTNVTFQWQLCNSHGRFVRRTDRRHKYFFP
jgi:hypothetical protein